MNSLDAIAIIAEASENELHDLVQYVTNNQDAMIHSTTAGGINAHRTSLNMRIPPGSRPYALIDRIFTRAVAKYPGCTGLPVELSTNEGFNILQYNQHGRYNLHVDDSTHLHRRLSGLLYLNDDYEGGELFFPKQKLTYKPKRGTVVLFPSGFMFPHASLPIKSGSKLAVVTWFK